MWPYLGSNGSGRESARDQALVRLAARLRLQESSAALAHL
jgi:hypothetical protein